MRARLFMNLQMVRDFSFCRAHYVKCMTTASSSRITWLFQIFTGQLSRIFLSSQRLRTYKLAQFRILVYATLRSHTILKYHVHVTTLSKPSTSIIAKVMRLIKKKDFKINVSFHPSQRTKKWWVEIAYSTTSAARAMRNFIDLLPHDHDTLLAYVHILLICQNAHRTVALKAAYSVPLQMINYTQNSSACRPVVKYKCFNSSSFIFGYRPQAAVLIILTVNPVSTCKLRSSCPQLDMYFYSF